VTTGEDVSENKDGSVLKSRIKNGQGVNPPKDGAVCNGMYRLYSFKIL